MFSIIFTPNRLSLWLVGLALLIIIGSCTTGNSQKEDMINSVYWVNSHKVPCEGVAPMQCLQIKKGKNDAWQYFYSRIEGFDFEPGYLYKLEVQEEKLDPNQVPADASSISYTLVSVLEKNEDPFYALFGTYLGTIPCADCEGIETTLKLMEDGTFIRDSRYLGKQDQPFNESGSFELDRETSMVAMSSSDGSEQLYQFEEQALFHLDKQGNRIEGDLAEHYKLAKKMTDQHLEDKKWILSELMGQEVVRVAGNSDASIIFQSEEGRASGSNSCNQFNSSYRLLPSKHIEISPGMVTLRACENMETEKKFGQMLPKVDHYDISEHMLSFRDVKNETIARFRLAKEDE